MEGAWRAAGCGSGAVAPLRLAAVAGARPGRQRRGGEGVGEPGARC